MCTAGTASIKLDCAAHSGLILERTVQEAQAVKGSQGAGKVDETLDRSRASADLDAAAPAAVSKPAPPPGQGRKKKGRK